MLAPARDHSSRSGRGLRIAAASGPGHSPRRPAVLPATTTARLATLPRYEGHPVPFVVPWGGCRTVRARDAALGWVQNCECVPGRCTPHFGQLCPPRQRQVMLGRACQVCGHPVAAGQPVWFCTIQGREWNREPGFHAGCGQVAFRACPGLAGYRRDPGTRVLVAGCTTYRLAFSLSGDDGPCCLTPAQAKASCSQGRTVRWAWAALDNPAFYTIGEWLRHAYRCRRRSA